MLIPFQQSRVRLAKSPTGPARVHSQTFQAVEETTEVLIEDTTLAVALIPPRAAVSVVSSTRMTERSETLATGSARDRLLLFHRHRPGRVAAPILSGHAVTASTTEEHPQPHGERVAHKDPRTADPDHQDASSRSAHLSTVPQLPLSRITSGATR